MPNVWSKLLQVIGPWLCLVIGIFLMPILLLPPLLFGCWGGFAASIDVD